MPVIGPAGRRKHATRLRTGADSGAGSRNAQTWVQRRSVDDVVYGKLAQLPFTGLRVVAGGGEHVPVGIIQLRMIGAIVVP
jgi:hypothetical protein